METHGLRKLLAATLAGGLLSTQQGVAAFAAVVSVPRTVAAPIGFTGTAGSAAGALHFPAGSGPTSRNPLGPSDLVGVLPGVTRAAAISMGKRTAGAALSASGSAAALTAVPVRLRKGAVSATPRMRGISGVPSGEKRAAGALWDGGPPAAAFTRLDSLGSVAAEKTPSFSIGRFFDGSLAREDAVVPERGGLSGWESPRSLRTGLGPKASPSERKVLDKVTQELGPVVAPDEAPVVYATLETIFSRLGAAQQKLFPADAVSINHIHLIDTPVLNAFVYPMKTPGVRRSSNLVFVTTGLLKKMLGEEPARLKDGLVRVAGILSHELAHPLDNIDTEGILTNYGKEIGGQAREIRADSEGAMIAKEAGYPVESVYESLKRLFADETGGGLAEALMSTHPQNDLRLAMQRMLLTMDRYEKGSRAPAYPEAAPAGILTELAGIEDGAVAGRFSPPQDLAEALDRLDKVAESKRGEAYQLLEFNRLILSVDALLARKGEDLGEEEFRLFTEISRLLAKPSKLDIVDREGMNRLFTQESHSEEFLAYPSHETFMKKIPAYGSPRYLRWASVNYSTKKDSDYGSAQRGLRGLANVLPSEHIFAIFGDRIAEGLIANMRSFPNSRYVYDQSVAKGQSPEFQARLAVLFHEKILPRLSEEERIAFFIESTHDKYSYVFPQVSDPKAKDSRLGILKRRVRLMGDPRLKTLQRDYRAAMQSIWDNRGYYGALDLILAFNLTDWDAIFAVLDIDPKAGRGQLRQAVKAFAKTPAYTAVLRTISGGNLDTFRMLKMGHPMGKMGELSWLDDSLGPHLRADSNASLQAEPELHALAKQIFAGAYYESRHELFRRTYARALAEALAGTAGRAMTIAELGAAHRAVIDGMVGGARVSAALADVQAEAISASPLSAPDKKAMLQAVFLEGYDENERVGGLTFDRAGDWLSREDAGPKTVLRVLIRHGLVQDALDLFTRLLARNDFRKSARGDGFSSYVSAVSDFKAELLADLEKALARESSDEGKAARLRVFLEAVADPGDGDYPAPEVLNTPELRDIKTRAAALASGLELDFSVRLRLFRLLTGAGATSATDAYFQKRLAASQQRPEAALPTEPYGEEVPAPHSRGVRPRDSARSETAFDDDAASAAGLPLSAILEQGRIAGSGLQLSLTRRLLEPEIARLKSRPQDPEGLNRLIETINAYVRQGSLTKDEFLESLAWRLELSGKELGAFIEDEKSYNWRKANPMLLRFGSALSAEIAKLSAKARADFIAFLINPQGRELPDPILKELQKNAYQAALAVDAAEDSHSSRAELKKKSDRAAYLMKLEIEAALIDASPFERIPLLELLLSAGRSALRNVDDFPLNISRVFLRYAPDSDEENMLAAYLAVVPAYEQTVSLAYLLSQAGGDKTSVKHIFEVFQTVGVKFGQMSSTWKLFGEEIARETASLKNSARPMTKDEILAAASKELTPEEFARIKRLKKVVGSASLKTVVLVELQDGREVVMMLRRPHAAEQIETNLRLGADFLRELDRRGLSRASVLFDTVLDAVRQQLAEEFKFSREAEHIRAARRHFEALNRSMRSRLGPWRFEVPALVEDFSVRDSILFMEKASGVTYDKLSPEERGQVGPLIAESSLSLLFEKGWFDADRHTGNQLIDPQRKRIHPIDFGQATEFSRTAFWKSDDRYELAQFLRALGADDAAGVLRHGRAMASGRAEALSALKAEVAKAVSSGSSFSDRLIALVSAFAGAGLPLQGKFTFGAFKGLMTLYGERYVPEEGFRRMLGRKIASLLKWKFPRTIKDSRGSAGGSPGAL